MPWRPSYGNGTSTKERAASTVDLCVTLLGVVGFLGFLAAARMSGEDSLPFDLIAVLWFVTFCAVKIGLPRLLQGAVGCNTERQSVGLTIEPELHHVAVGDHIFLALQSQLADIAQPRRRNLA